MVKLITYVIYIQTSIFRNFLKNEKIISTFFVLSSFAATVFFDKLAFRYLRKKINNLEILN